MTTDRIEPIRVGFIGERRNRISDAALRSLLERDDVEVCWIVESDLSKEQRARLYKQEFDYGTIISFARRVRDSRGSWDLRRVARSARIPYLVPRERSINDGLPAEMYESPSVAFALVAGCDQILNENGLKIAQVDVVNYHYSLLPSYRGKFALFWQWWDEQSEVGFTFHRVDLGIDTGAPLLQRSIPRVPDEPMAALVDRVLAETKASLPDLVRAFRENSAAPAEPVERPMSYRSVSDYETEVTVRRSESVDSVMSRFERLGWVRLPNGLILRTLRRYEPRDPQKFDVTWAGLVVPLADGAVIGGLTPHVPFWVFRLLLGGRMVAGLDGSEDGPLSQVAPTRSES